MAENPVLPNNSAVPVERPFVSEDPGGNVELEIPVDTLMQESASEKLIHQDFFNSEHTDHSTHLYHAL